MLKYSKCLKTALINKLILFQKGWALQNIKVAKPLKMSKPLI
jgi:hypothetical protein